MTGVSGFKPPPPNVNKQPYAQIVFLSTEVSQKLTVSFLQQFELAAIKPLLGKKRPPTFKSFQKATFQKWVSAQVMKNFIKTMMLGNQRSGQLPFLG